MVILNSRKLEDVPKGSVILSEEEALDYQWEAIHAAKGASSLWSLKYGAGMLGALSSLTGIYINAHYRSKLRLGSFGAFSSYLPIVILPAIVSTLHHKVFTQSFILLKKEPCPVCIQVRASLVQTGIGVLYPCALAPLASYMFAARHFTFRLPSIYENPKQLFAVYKKMTKPLTMFLAVALGVHMISTMALTHKEINDFYKFEKNMIKAEGLLIDEEVLLN